VANLEIPPAVVRMNLAAAGEAGRAWLAELPGMIDQLRRRWDLTIGPAFEGGVVGFVAPAERGGGDRVVIKVSPVDEETRTEADALRLWDGDGAVRLLDAEPALGALLLERLDPGTSLEEHPDRDEAIAIGCALLKRLWRPVPPGHPFPLVRDLAFRWATEIPERFDRLGPPFEAALAEEAAALCAELGASTEPTVLANRDYHLGNVLAAQREPWLLIDPKPLVGGPAFDTGHLLRSLLPSVIDRAAVRGLVQRLAGELGLGDEAVRRWAFVRSVEDALWGLSIGGTEVERDVECARSLAANPSASPTTAGRGVTISASPQTGKGDPSIQEDFRMGNPITPVLRAVDRFQQRHRWLALPYAVVKKFGEDRAGNFAALIAYYGFFSLFPLLLVLVSVLGLVLRGNPSLRQSIVHSALSQFPVIGDQLQQNLDSLTKGNSVPLGIGILGTLWAGLGVVKSLEEALNTVWDVPYKRRPNAIVSTMRALLMLGVLGIITVVSALVAGAGAGSDTWWWAVIGILMSLVLNFVLFLLAFRILTRADVSWADVRPGAILGAIGWTTLQAVGGFYVSHQLKGASQVYGTFAVVIGLLAWMYLGAQLTMYVAEFNAVRAQRLWPRGLVNPPFTEADEWVLKRLARVEERHEEERVEATLQEGTPEPAAKDKPDTTNERPRKWEAAG
jgi:YihY family inner membrane protein